MLAARIFGLFKANTKVAAVGRRQKIRGAAFGRATSSVVFFVFALNSVNIVAVTTYLYWTSCSSPLAL